MLLVLRTNAVSEHIPLQGFRNADRAVLVEVVFQECDQHAGRSNNGVVQGVGEVLVAVLALDADSQPSCLCVAQIGAAAHFEVLLLTGRPCFYGFLPIAIFLKKIKQMF